MVLLFPPLYMADLYGSKVLQLHLQLDERPAGVVQLHLAPPRVGTKVHHFADYTVYISIADYTVYFFIIITVCAR